MASQDTSLYLEGKVVWDFVLISPAEWWEFTAGGGQTRQASFTNPP